MFLVELRGAARVKEHMNKTVYQLRCCEPTPHTPIISFFLSFSHGDGGGGGGSTFLSREAVRYPGRARDTRNVKRTKNGDSARVL